MNVFEFDLTVKTNAQCDWFNFLIASVDERDQRDEHFISLLSQRKKIILNHLILSY